MRLCGTNAIERGVREALYIRRGRDRWVRNNRGRITSTHMCGLVPPKRACLRKGFFADVAFMRLFPAVNSRMLLQSARKLKAEVAVAAFEWPVVAVLFLMRPKPVRRNEPAIAFVAFIRFYARVDSLVHLKSSQRRKAFPAIVATERLVARLVLHQHVHA